MDKPCLTSDDFDKEEEDTYVSPPDILDVIDQLEKAESEETVGDTGAQVQNLLGNFGGVINKTLHIKRKHMGTYVKDCFKSSNEKLEQVWDMNAQERKKINSKFSKQYMTTLQQWDTDIQKLDEELEISANNSRKEQKAFKLSNSDPRQSLQAIRELHENFMKSLEDKEKDNNDLATYSGGELKNQIATFQRNLIKHTAKYCSYDKILD